MPNNNVAADGGLAPTDNNLAPSMDNFVPTPDASSTGQAPRSSNLGLVGVSRGGSGIAVADGFYLDDAIIRNQMRLRFDAGFNNIFPDRAEFFYAQCGCFGPPAPGPGAAGVFESGVDYQEYSAYFEFAARPKFSGFLEVPVRSINPEVNANESGFSDLIVGGKFALIACKDRWATLQFKVYTPTGDASKGLGTGHASLEPGILLFRKLTNRLSLQAEVRDWIPLSDSTNGGLPFDGNVLRYGIGTAYDIFQSGGFGCCDPSRRLTAVTEVVGWSVLGGQKTAFNVGAVDATGDTIVNLKLGLRYTAGNRSIGFGWGHALTGATWYEDIARLEYRVAF